MKETRVRISCDFCNNAFRIEGREPSDPMKTYWIWIGELDVCPNCAFIIKKAVDLKLANRIAQEANERLETVIRLYAREPDIVFGGKG